MKGELDDQATTVYKGIRGRGGAAGGDQRADAARGSGRSGRCLSTLVRWIGRRRDRLSQMPGEAPQADMAAELKRLRRENEILRQERDILKRATAFFAREGSR